MSRIEQRLSLWNAVSETDPATTKRVNHRGGFTAIGAYHQIKRATEQFGPVGQGWGWYVVEIRTDVPGLVFVHLNLWWSNDGPDDKRSFHVLGGAETAQGGANGRPDSDCVKKALTDAITKGLSYLGFNADVFLGQFEDNKYVQAGVRDADASERSIESSTDIPRNPSPLHEDPCKSSRQSLFREYEMMRR